jgi:hypothetical protein
MAVRCQNLPLGALSSRSAPSVLVGELFKKFGLFLNTGVHTKPSNIHKEKHTQTLDTLCKSLSAPVVAKHNYTHIIKLRKYNELLQASDCTYLINNHDASSLLLSSRVLILYQYIQRTSACLCEHCYAQ